ncbi:tetratricopeptide (TPR) repeat protein [Paenibacillus endophyticus]|uniref:Tetratricopeptide (TPR) repeat protein n=1 Tax=Paenibacillus endophyticus TaxID=1294268 RepID=A0A7W5CD54_9BACL|nr:hypothetical protein [Paenibacillus endophyticus]MBB3154949.1 tetratricopeptide (TPR) repeat protein [Paenibacillus endophyticus]
MLKFGLFVFLFWLLGNPFIAIIVMLLLLYLLDRRFVGISPSILKPLKRLSRIRKLKQQINQSPNDVSSKHELARLLLERKKYGEALRLLEPIEHVLADSAEYWDDLGIGYINSGNEEKGMASTLRALELNPRVKYGAPYLRLAAHLAAANSSQALAYLHAFQEVNSSSCEAYHYQSSIYKKLGNTEEARLVAEEGLRVYRMLPKYKKRQERQWAVRLWFRKRFG